jgi:D-alanyl-lipoteichoic acid acyltransferase DltB (MBOAT superfamily)
VTFTATGFLPFVLATFSLAVLAGPRRRWVVLLVASAAFYASVAAPIMVATLGGVTLCTYACAARLEREERPARRRLLVGLGVATSLGALVVLRDLGPTAHLVAAVGVSYFTLQAIGYLLDVRDGAIPAERHLGHFALYLAFFPRVIQGPIERAEGFLAQLRQPRPIAASDLAAAAQLFTWGLFQKVVVADRLAPFVDAVYGDPGAHAGPPVLLATYLFAAQIYFDFAGYTDMALGTARLFGLRLTPNFEVPYAATSVTEFWRRWHISFSSWILDYLFRPMQLSLRGWRTWGTPLALLATFLLSGLWHGATWGFLAWGLLHGLYLGTSALYRTWRRPPAVAARPSRVRRWLAIAATFHLVCLAWVFFRAPTVGGALAMLRSLVTGTVALATGSGPAGGLAAVLDLGPGRRPLLLSIGLLALGAALRAYLRRAGVTGPRPPRPWTLDRTAVFALVVYLVAFFGTSAQSFLYERF